jgi:hypothetical protein
VEWFRPQDPADDLAAAAYHLTTQMLTVAVHPRRRPLGLALRGLALLDLAVLRLHPPLRRLDRRGKSRFVPTSSSASFGKSRRRPIKLRRLRPRAGHLNEVVRKLYFGEA